MSAPSRAHKVVSILVLVSLALGSSPAYALSPAEAAMVTTFDLPEPASIEAMDIQEVQAADPGAGINLIEAPQANNMGTARLRYPIEVPPGRLGMQPQLTVEYDSSAGDGWLGLGWDLPVPAIAVDTRWGVPRYDPGQETETYLLNGEQLTPLAHRGPWLPRSAEKAFQLRVEGQFLRIVRHGTHPAGYWWEVTDKDGTVSRYGGILGTGEIDVYSVLTTDPVDNRGSIYLWPLRLVRDTHGNTVEYRYQRIRDTGLANGTVLGHQLYLQAIQYTGHGEEAGPYLVEFVRDRELGEPRRQDAIIDARGGFKQVTADLLRWVKVTYRGELVRSYELKYNQPTAGAFHKTLLTSITQYGKDGVTPFHTHQFTYYDEQRQADGSYRGFSPVANAWQTGDDGVSIRLYEDVSASAISGADNDFGNAHFYGGFNPWSPTKNMSGGGKIGYSNTQSEGVLELVDINGDNLPDKVFKVGGSVYYRANTSGPDADPNAVTFGEPQLLYNLPGISEETTHVFPVVGPELYFGVDAIYNYSHSWSDRSQYLADANGDGLMDLVDDRSVLFNGGGESGAIVFTPNSALSPVPIVPGNGIIASGIISGYEQMLQDSIDTYPLHDTLARWIAPFAGTVQISGTVALTDTAILTQTMWLGAQAANTLVDCRQHEAADGVRVAIEQHGSRKAELWSTVVTTITHPVAPAGVDAIPVRAGDRIYFRVQSRFDGACDQVAWDPEVNYLNIIASTQMPQRSGTRVYLPMVMVPPGAASDRAVGEPGEAQAGESSSAEGASDLDAGEQQSTQSGALNLDANLLDPRRYKASEDFVLAGRPDIGVSMPFTGTVRLELGLQKLGRTTDDITVLVKKNGRAVFTQEVAWDQTGSITPTLLIDVVREDTIQLQGRVDSPIDLTQIRWIPRLYYVASPDVEAIQDDQGNYLVQLHPPYHIDTYPVQVPFAPSQSWIAPFTGKATIASQFPFMWLEWDGSVVFTVKRRGELVAKRTIWVVNGWPQNIQLTLDVEQGQEFFFDYSSDVPQWLAIYVTGAPQTSIGGPFPWPSARVISQWNITANPLLLRMPWAMPEIVPLSYGIFPLPYRGWAYAGYNGNRERASALIDESALREQFDTGSSYSPEKAKAYPFSPYPEQGVWRGPDELGWARAGYMSSSRLGLDTIDVPEESDFAGAYAVDKHGHGDQHAWNVGAMCIDGGGATGPTYGEVDYLDMNGDRFPDIVGDDTLQYTTPLGGLEGRVVAGPGKVRQTQNTDYSMGICGSVSASTPNAEGHAKAAAKGSPKGNSTRNMEVSLGFGGRWSWGEAEADYDLIDINGDGLLDRVTSGSQLMVALNLGYGFAASEPWGYVPLETSSGEEREYGPNVSLGFNDGRYSFAGNLSFTQGESWIESALLDINGDGLPDRVLTGGNSLKVAINTGNGFAPAADWGGALSDTLISDHSIAFGGGGYFTVGIGPLCLAGCYIILNPGGGYTRSMARRENDLRDVNGDGYADHIASSDESALQVAVNLTGRTNLLRSVIRPLGATIELEYEREGNTYADPESHWVLSKATLNDGQPGDGVDRTTTAYQYDEGYYDRREREFYGFGRVVETTLDDQDNPRQAITSTYRTDSYYTRGLLQAVVTADGDGNKYLETEYTYTLWDTTHNRELADPHHLTATVFPQLRRIDKRYYEGQMDPGKATSITCEYDGWGNLTHMVDAADVGAEDDVEIAIAYSSYLERYIVGRAISMTVTASGAEMRRREATLQPDTGDIRQVWTVLADGSAAITDVDYDVWGNVVRIAEPANYREQRYTLTYAYDEWVHTYVTQIADSLSYTSTARYDLAYGQLECSTDVNGRSTEYTYDQFGRMLTVVGPHQTGTGLYTLRFQYHHQADVPWALTQQIDVYRDVGDPIETIVFVDGLGRVIQTQKDAAVYVDGSSQDQVVASGAVVLDHAGRPVQQYYPTVTGLGSPGTILTTRDTVTPTVTTYDALGRVTSIVEPDGASTDYAYGFGPDRQGRTQFVTRVTDANGVPKEIYRDVRGLITSLQEWNDGGRQAIWTSYAYDPLEQVVRIVDDQDNVTEVGYDNMGRQTRISSPDSGLTETVYDLASNPIQRIPANLRAEGVAIAYEYDYNRLTGIAYPHFPQNNVTYTYGETGAADNRAGRIVTIADGSGLEDFSYGPAGEIVKTVKTVASDTQGNSSSSPEVYTTEYVYDAWNRLQSLTYPDGELLTYEYDSGGLLKAIRGSKQGHGYEYLRRMEYDKFGDPVFAEAGNGVRTSYSYNPLDRCLEVIQAGRGSGSSLFQDLRLTYDNVDNIVAQANLAADRSPSEMGGATQYAYQYDDLRRLVHAEGTFDFRPGKQQRYELDIAYDTVHNIVAKTQLHELREPSDVWVAQHETTYDWSYAYEGPQPHPPTHIGERAFSYDAGGNQVGWEDDQNGTRRVIVWDEENRIQSISENGQTMTYRYNAAGERVIRSGPQGETVYVNPFFTIRNREVGTKHVYAGSTRIASKLMKQDKPDANPEGSVPREKDLYFYHPDHLGTSMYVTDADGELYEHLEYMPFGETFVEESSNTQRTPYLFTAKELDEETQLYYYGARYYDPKTSVWLSPDPLLDQYLPAGDEESGLPGLGGVYNSRNLALYGYAGQNPVTYLDVDGRASGFSTALRFGQRRQLYRWTQKTGAGQRVSKRGYRISISGPGISVTWYGKSEDYSHEIEVALPGIRFIRAKLRQPTKEGRTHEFRVETAIAEMKDLMRQLRKPRKE